MAGKKQKGDKVDKAISLLDSGLGIASSLVEKRASSLQQEAVKKAEEIKEDVLESAYEAKRGLLRTVVEILFLSTGILALIGGVILYFENLGYDLSQILVVYGVIVLLISLFKMKTSP